MADQTTTIPKGWKMTTLGEIPDSWHILTAEKFCVKVADGTHATPKPVLNGRYLVTSKHIKSGKVDLSSAYQISQDDFDEVNKRSKVDRWDVLFSMIGTVGEIALIDKDPIFAIKNVGLFKCGDEHKAKWLFYFLRGKIGQGEIQRRMSGTTQSYVTLGDLRSFPVIVPSSTDEIRAIAAVLSSLDDKIELLREQNKTLEATAQAIFKEWFVYFNFPGANGKMIDSELGEIPEGWKVDRLSEIIVFEGGAQPPKSEHIYEPRDGYVRFIQNRDYSNSSHITYIKESKKNKLCEVFDIMMDKYGDVGVPRWGLVGAYNVALAKIVPKIKNSREYLRSYFSQRAVFSLLSASAQASTRGSLNEGTFKGVTLIIPDEITLERFEKLQSKFLSKILFNNAEVETLSQLRDTLLPKLMKGDVRVEGFEN